MVLKSNVFKELRVTTKTFLSIAVLLCMSISVQAQEKYTPDWESLLKYEVPEWFRDAKFGIFIHWGPTTVPAFESEWYGYHMHKSTSKDAKGNPSDKPSRSYTYHAENFGTPDKFGYTKFIPMFKAEKFDAKTWVDLIVEAGAKYIVPVGEHCDGFAMYNSNITRWNSVNMGPKRDISGELFTEARKHGLKIGMSSHYAYGWHWWTYKDEYETTNPDLRDFYWDAHDPWAPASEEFIQHWYDRSVDMMTQYKPDLFWFDLGFCEPAYEEARKKFIAEYYNQGIDNNQEVVLNYKNIHHRPVPDGAAVLDVESGKLDRIRDEAWQTDMSLGGWRWGYCANYELRPASAYINDLIDIVSKNGCLLLNIAPNKHGIIPDDQVAILKEIGSWLKVNGEGIYDTRPFEVFGQGPTNAKMVMHGNMKDKGYTPEDIRYTKKGNTVYAFLLEWPENKEKLKLYALGAEQRLINDAIKSISVLGSEISTNWEQAKEALIIDLPAQNPVNNALCFKIELEDPPSDIF